MKPIPFPSFLVHSKMELGPNPLSGKKRGASNWPFYGIVRGPHTKPWTMEQEKIEYYWHTGWILVVLGLLFVSVWADLAVGDLTW